jgi:hypothetical protein
MDATHTSQVTRSTGLVSLLGQHESAFVVIVFPASTDTNTFGLFSLLHSSSQTRRLLLQLEPIFSAFVFFGSSSTFSIPHI